jgi:trehalose 6-phosphate synthase/phosphatase
MSSVQSSSDLPSNPAPGGTSDNRQPPAQPNVPLTPLLDGAALLKQYQKAKKRLILLDYDGTLTPIVRDSDMATPSETLMLSLTALTSNPANSVWIISGRDQTFLNKWLGSVRNLGLSAEHGCFSRRPGDEEWENLAEQADMSWQPEVMEVFERYTASHPGVSPMHYSVLSYYSSKQATK